MIMAYDSRVTCGTYIDDDDCNKCTTVKGVRFFCTGSEESHDTIINYWFKKKVKPENIDGDAFVWDGQLWHVGEDDGRIYKSKCNLDKYYAIGSGASYAITAMDMGATAYQAIKQAMKRDACTGGKIRRTRLK